MREKIREILGGTALCFSFPGGRNFEEMVEFAHQHGATHINIGELPFHYNELLPDNRDPYPNWSQRSIGLFRVMPPDVVAPYFSESLIETNQQFMDQAVATIRKYGLKACLSGTEPLWLPESAYRAHPRWRGVQCELGRIAGKSYFSPAIDDPEVLSLYQESMRKFCERYPDFEMFRFWTNDCGAGVPWSAYSYPGPNGPIRHRMNNPGNRITGWMNALRLGAQDAGSSVVINLSSFSFPPGETAAVIAQLGEHLFFNGKNGNGKPVIGIGASLCSSPDNPSCGLLGVIPPMDFADQFIQILDTGDDGAMKCVTVDPAHKELAGTIMENAVRKPVTVPKSIRVTEALYETAATLTDTTNAGLLLDCWAEVEKAIHCILQVRQRGMGSNLALAFTTARWLHRPLVPEPLQLTEDETRFFRNYLFSAGTPEQNANLCYLLGKPVFIGDGVVWMTRWALHEAIGRFAKVENQLRTLIPELPTKNQTAITLYADKIKAWRCVLETGKNVVMYQHALSIADQPRFAANPLDFDDNIQFDQRALELRKIARSELDNTMELVEILEKNPDPLFVLAETREQQTVFRYGPDLLDGLRHKMNVMLDHWHDYERLYPTSKVYEFEPGRVIDHVCNP